MIAQGFDNTRIGTKRCYGLLWVVVQTATAQLLNVQNLRDGTNVRQQRIGATSRQSGLGRYDLPRLVEKVGSRDSPSENAVRRLGDVNHRPVRQHRDLA